MSKKAPRRGTAPRGTDKDGTMSLGAVLKNTLPSLLLTLLLGALLLLLATAILLKTEDPSRLCRPVALAVLYLTAVAGGAVATWLYGRRTPFLCGLFLGAALFAVTLLCALFLPRSADAGWGLTSLLLRALLLPAAILGAFLAARQKKRPRRRHRR